MSKSNDFENALLELIFNAEPIAGLAANATTGALTNLFIALHTADPGETGNQGTNEVAYTGYARVPVARTTGGWVVSGSIVNPAAAVEFGEMTGGAPGTATHLSIGTHATGAGMVLYKGPVVPEIPFAEGIAPRIRASSSVEEE